jgi:hypothetical protein
VGLKAFGGRLRATIRSAVGTTLLLCGGTIAGLLLLEVVARWYFAGQRPGGTGEQALYSTRDTLLGWRNRPGAELKYDRREFQTSIRINALGFRDIERSRIKPSGRARVIVLGDSFIEAYAVELHESFTRRVEVIAETGGCALDVVNAGVHAYSIDQEYLWFDSVGTELEPDVVVMAVYYNDIINTVRANYWGSPKPVLEVREGRLVPINTPLSPPPDADPSTIAQAIARARTPRPASGSALKFFVVERLLTGAPRFYGRLAELGLVDPIAPDDVVDEMRVYKTRGLLAEVERAWEKTRQILSAFADRVRETGAKPLIAYIPARFEVVDADWDLTRLRYGMNDAVWDRSLVARNIGAMAARLDVPFLDFTKALRASTGLLEGSPYFKYDGHWNAHGNDVAARSAVEFLRNGGIIPCANP